MKKKLFSMLAIFFVAALCVGFTSCGDDDDDGDGGSSSGSSKVPAPYLVDSNGNKIQVLSVSSESGNYVSPFAIFSYDDNGKLTRTKYHDYDYVISGSDFVLKYSDKYDDIVIKIRTNSSGLITSIEYTDKYLGSASGTGDGTESYTYTYKYNSNKQLTNASMVGTEGDGDKVSNNVTCTWSNGNLVTLVFEDKETDSDTGEVDKGKKTYTFTYGNQENTFKQLPECIWDRICHDGPEWLCAIGLFGVGPANLPTGYTRVSSSGSNYSYSLSYTLNADGSIKTESRKESGSSYSNNTISYTYK